MAKDEFEIRTGMNVVDTEGNRLGSLESILVEDPSGMSRFIVVEKRLLPVETIEGVEGDDLKLVVPKEKLREFPERRGEEGPTEQDQKQAYDVINLEGPLVEDSGRGPGTSR